MITFITGIPGAGKTLNTLKMVVEEHKGQDRPIYYRGIRELQLDWKEITDEECHKWFDYPEGSIFVIDEVQQIFPNRSNNKPVPEAVKRLDTHRHGGYDFYVITQKPTMVDFGLRGFAGRHYHYERAFGRNSTRQLEWQRAVDDTQDYHIRQDAQVSRVNFDKKYYGIYKSAEVHTYKPRIPKAAWMAGIAIVATGSAAVYAYNNISERMDDEPVRTEYQGDDVTFNPSQFDPIPLGARPFGQEYDTTEQFIEKHTPRIESIPWSAPVYDSLLEVKTYPRPQCIRFEKQNICKCYTQQATPIDIDSEMCNSLVDNGWFNPFKDEGIRGDRQGGVGLPAPASPQQVAQYRPTPKPADNPPQGRTRPRIIILGTETRAGNVPRVIPSEQQTQPGVIGRRQIDINRR